MEYSTHQPLVGVKSLLWWNRVKIIKIQSSIRINTHDTPSLLLSSCCSPLPSDLQQQTTAVHFCTHRQLPAPTLSSISSPSKSLSVLLLCKLDRTCSLSLSLSESLAYLGICSFVTVMIHSKPMSGEAF